VTSGSWAERREAPDGLIPSPGRAGAAFCDGSVRFVADGVNPAAWRAMAIRAGGEVVE